MPDLPPILGLHHVTAITADAAANHAFYTGLGLRLVKQTVNYDDPTSLHLYYGDDTGSPGSIVTFFVHTGLPKGTTGAPAVTATMLDLPDHSTADPEAEFDEAEDPDGMSLWLAPGETDARLAQVVHKVASERVETSAEFMSRFLSLSTSDVGDDRRFLALPGEPHDPFVQISPSSVAGRPGAGTVHHVAFRVADREGQEALRAALVEAGVNVSPVMDRTYFTSIYFREPGGVLLEVATDGPGFGVDEDDLGRTLCLPPHMERIRPQIEAAVPWVRPG